MSDKIQKQFETILREFAQYAGAQERTSIYPGAEVINATYTADRIIVRGRQGYYEPTLIIPGSTFTNGDLVTVLYVQGAEPIALQQSPGSGTSSYPGHTVQDEAVSLPQRRYLNFTGAGVTASDDAGNNQTDVTIPGGGGGAPVDAQYLTLALDATLTDERRFVPGDGLNPNDGGAGGDYDLEVDIHGLAALGAAPVAADEFMVYDDTAGALRKATWTNILSGIAGWPFTGKVLTVDTTDTDADYATIAAAIAAAGAGDTILLSSEQIGCVNQTLPDGVHLGCLGPSAAILTNSTNAITLNVGNGSVVFNIEVRNTYAAAAVYAIYMPTNTDTARFYNVTANPDNSAGVGNAYAFYVGGSSELYNCRGITNAKAFGYGLVGVGTGDKKVHGGRFDGTGASGGDDVNNQAGTTTLNNPTLVNSKIDTLLAASGTRGNWQTASGVHISDEQRVTNTSGGAVSAGAVGYIDNAGQFKTTTTAYLDAAWAVILVGGANNANVYVTRRGRVTVTLNGNCSAGDYLYTSTTAGQAQPLSTMRPEVFGVALTANAGGAGGTCTALLYCNRALRSVSVSEVYFVFAHSSFDFVATIASLPGGAVLTYNAPSSGNEDTIAPYSITYNYKLVLHNTTRSTSALIDSVVVATNTITLTGNVPAGWQVGDTITARSQTAAGTVGTSYYYEIDTNDSIDTMTTALKLSIEKLDSGGAGEVGVVGTFEATPKVEVVRVQVAGAGLYNGLKVEPPVIDGKFVLASTASGSSTSGTVLRQVGYFVAAP